MGIFILMVYPNNQRALRKQRKNEASKSTKNEKNKKPDNKRKNKNQGESQPKPNKRSRHEEVQAIAMQRQINQEPFGFQPPIVIFFQKSKTEPFLNFLKF